MPATLLKFDTEGWWQECYNCGIWFATSTHFDKERRKDKRSFFCPNGHSQAYLESEADRVRKEMQAKLDEVNKHAEWLRAQASTARSEAERHRKALARQTRRATAGMCLHCNRTFKQLAAHMKCKHPDSK